MEVNEEDLEQFAQGNFSNALIHGYLQRDIVEALLLSKYNTGRNGLINEIAVRGYSAFGITAESLKKDIEEKIKMVTEKTRLSLRERLDNYFLDRSIRRLTKNGTLQKMMEKTRNPDLQ